MRIGSLFAIAGLVVGLGGGCSESHGGPPDNSSFGDAESPYAWLCGSGERRVVDLDHEVGALGFAAAEVLAFAEGVHRAPLRWATDGRPLRHSDGTVTISPEQGEGTLEVTVERADDVQVFSPESVWSGHGINCRHWYEIPVRLTLTSSGTALRETLHATLRTEHRRAAFLAVETSSGLLGGAFSTRVQLDGQEVAPERLMLHLAISERAVSGELLGRWLTLPAPWGTQQLATWGPADCDDFGYSFAEPTEGTTAEAMVERIANLGTLDVTWDVGPPSTATLSFVPDLAGSCFEQARWGERDFYAKTFGVVTLQSADGRVDARLQRAEVTALNGLPGDVHLSVETYESAGLTPAELGFPQVPADAVVAPSVGLGLYLDATDQLSPSSQFTLYGFTPGYDPACDTSEPPPDCPRRSALQRATLSR